MVALSARSYGFARQAERAPLARSARTSTGLRVEWKSLGGLDAGDLARWRDLVGQALEPNVFLEPAFAVAAAALPAARGIGALLVHAGPRLVGFLPGRTEGIRAGRPVPTFVAWTHPYAPLSTALVDREMADDVIETFFAGLARLPQRPRLVLLPLIPEEGAVARRLVDLLYRHGQAMRRLDPHRRAALVLQAGVDPVAAISTGRLKELRRQHRRLVETGAIEHKVVTDADAIGAAVETYLALEAMGWKGRAGSAAGLEAATSAFLLEAVVGLARGNKARVELLMREGAAIAAAIVLFSGSRAWFWKIAYDEAFARYSPGVQLALALTQSLGSDPRITFVDSCAVAGHPLVDALWGERLALADWLVALPGAGRFDLQAAYAAESLRRQAVRSLKFLRDRLRA
jgi:CelD/BcsL family acetyltransferase involved in cellulose biosynthesis